MTITAFIASLLTVVPVFFSAIQATVPSAEDFARDQCPGGAKFCGGAAGQVLLQQKVRISESLHAEQEVQLCENIPGPIGLEKGPGVPRYAFLGDKSVKSFVKDTFSDNKNKLDKVNATHCSVTHQMFVAERVPFDPFGKVPTDMFNAHVSMNVAGLPRPIQIGDAIVCPNCLASGWISELADPDPVLPLKDDLTVKDSGHPPDTPDASVTCVDHTQSATVKGNKCAVCDIPSTCLAGLGCFRYLSTKCFYLPGTISAKKLAVAMVKKLVPYGKDVKKGKGRDAA